MKTTIMKIFKILLLALVCWVIVIAIICGLLIISDVIRGSLQQIAWCNSIDGNWGGGACYVKGVNIHLGGEK